ncbi:MAG: ABC transporter permease [Deltaproteobacteria bacterium]|nr:ABC transporter permease [Deltaproteobacteria bacterium]MCX7952259.1 ABC transporter permease [Deltaproteobacteria bacterium]
MFVKGLVKLGAIARRELTSLFVSPFIYFIVAALTVLALHFFIQYLLLFNAFVVQSRTQLAFEPQAGISLNMFIQGYFKVLLLIFVFFIPMAAMKVFAEEKRAGAFEFLVTCPLSTEAIALGKFIGFFLFLTLITIWISLPPISLFFFAELESPVVFANVLGFWLYTLCLGAIAVLISAASNNVITSAVVGMVVLLLYYVVGFSAESLSQEGYENLASFVRYISPIEQSEFFLRGMVKVSSVVYFVSVSLVCYLFSVRVLEAKRVSKI